MVKNSDNTQGTPHINKTFSFEHCPLGNAQITPPVKNDVLARITKTSNNDYDNDGSDNYNFGTFDNFGVKK